MGCSGDCKIQIYDFDFDDLSMKETSPGDSARYICDAPDAAQIEAAVMKSFADANPPKWQDTPYGNQCQGGDECACIPSEPDPSAWTVWSGYDLNPSVKLKFGKAAEDTGSGAIPTRIDCVFEISGRYWVSSAIAPGACQPKPKTRQRPKNPKRRKRPKKTSAVGGDGKTKGGKVEKPRKRPL